MDASLRDIIFLDIETVACTSNFTELNERLKIQWSRKAGFLKREEGVTDEELFHQRAGIYAEFGKIICIAVGKLFESGSSELSLKVKAYFGDEEKAVLMDFLSMLNKLDPATIKFCAHNGKEFDYPYISRRMLVNGIPLPQPLNLAGRKSWEVPHLDTMELWKFGDYKHYTSLDLLAAIFNIPTSKNGIDGSQVNAVYYKEKNLQKIKDYCMNDVVVLTQLYLRMKGLPLIKDANIHTTA